MNTLRRAFSSVPGAIEIYCARDRLKFYRGFGLFCFGHTVAWAGLTYYQGWHKLAEREKLIARFAEMRADLSALWPFGENASSDVGQKPAISIDMDSEEKGFFASWLAKFQKASQATKKYDTTLIPVFTALFAMLTFGMGVILPRRIVRRLTLLPRQASSSTAIPGLPNQLVEIETYGAFALRSDPVRFRVPLEQVQPLNSRTDQLQHLQFMVRNIPFRFIVEKEGAEFRNPHEYDFVFSAHRG